jgi:RNA polymerase sigma-70 factor (ECF subfamily)
MKAISSFTRGWELPFSWIQSSEPATVEADETLMQHLAGGNDTAFGELFERWKRPLISFFYRSLNDYEQAEDLTLDVARKVYAARNRYQPTAKFSTWIFQIAHNRLRDEFRKKQRRPQLVHDPEGWAYPPGTEADPRKLQDHEEWLEGALRSLTEGARSVLLLNIQQGLVPGEIAQILGMTPNHVRVVLHNARSQLKEKWRKDHE